MSAVTNNLIFSINGIVFAGALIASAVIINFSSNLFHYLKIKKLNFHFFFLFSIFIFIIYKMNRYGEYGNDAPAHFVMFLLVSEIIKNLESKNNISKNIPNYLTLAMFVIMNKVILITSILFPLILFTKKNFLNCLINKKTIFLIKILSIFVYFQQL